MLFAACLKGWRKMLCAIPFFFIQMCIRDRIDEAALAQALEKGALAGAGVDVLSTEPPTADNPLLTAKNCLITPHIAWAGYETRGRLLRICEDNLRAFCAGAPIHVVNP